MVNLLNFEFGEHLFFVLILLRITGIFFFAPVFGSNNINPTLVILFSFAISLLIFDIVPPTNIRLIDYSWIDFLVLAVKEFMLGYLIGLLPQIVFTAIEFAGSIIGNMMGISIVNLVDPQSDTQVSLIGSFKNAIALMVFLAIDAHHMVIHAIFESFRVLPLGGINIQGDFFDNILRYTSQIFILGIKISAPILILMFLTNVIMGFMARSIPNLNIFLVGFPISLLIGMLALLIGITPLIALYASVFEQVGKDIMILIGSLAS